MSREPINPYKMETQPIEYQVWEECIINIKKVYSINTSKNQ
jgi:hypothetical protein